MHGTSLLGRLNRSTMILRRDQNRSRRVSKSLINRSDRFDEVDCLAATVLLRGNSAKATSILDYELLIQMFRHLKDCNIELKLDKRNYYAKVISDIRNIHSDPLEIQSRDGNFQLVSKSDLEKYLSAITL